jgi:CRISPR system Cascade subunit CasD
MLNHNNPYLLLWLEGNFQSWGHNSMFNQRKTLDFPTKSGVLGLMLSAMGRNGEQREFLAEFSQLDMQVKAYSKTKSIAPYLFDYQTIGGGYDILNKHENLFVPKDEQGKNTSFSSVIINKYYLQDSIFAVFMEIPHIYQEEVKEGLLFPCRPIFLGRKNCTPTEFVFQGIFDHLSEAKEKANTLSKQKGIYHKFDVLQGESENKALKRIIINDIPVSLGLKTKYQSRVLTLV